MESDCDRRAVLRRGAAVAAAVGLAGCPLGGNSSADGYRARVGDGDWSSLTPVETDDTHQAFYHGGDATETTNATHGYVAAETATLFVHRSTASADGPSDALVLTYDARDSDTSGRARVEFDESIAPDEDLLVADGPFDRQGARTGDTYAESHLVHQWGSGNTDGVTISLDPFSAPTFEFVDVDGLESVRVLSAGDGDDPEVTTAGIDASVGFEF